MWDHTNVAAIAEMIEVDCVSPCGLTAQVILESETNEKARGAFSFVSDLLLVKASLFRLEIFIEIGY